MHSSGGHFRFGQELGQLGTLVTSTYTFRQQGRVKGTTWHMASAPVDLLGVQYEGKWICLKYETMSRSG